MEPLGRRDRTQSLTLGEACAGVAVIAVALAVGRRSWPSGAAWLFVAFPTLLRARSIVADQAMAGQAVTVDARITALFTSLGVVTAAWCVAAILATPLFPIGVLAGIAAADYFFPGGHPYHALEWSTNLGVLALAAGGLVLFARILRSDRRARRRRTPSPGGRDGASSRPPHDASRSRCVGHE